jgi:hypothetical protein
MKGREGFIICQVICKCFLRLQDLANCRGNFSMAYYAHVSLLADDFDVGGGSHTSPCAVTVAYRHRDQNLTMTLTIESCELSQDLSILLRCRFMLIRGQLGALTFVTSRLQG